MDAHVVLGVVLGGRAAEDNTLGMFCSAHLPFRFAENDGFRIILLKAELGIYTAASIRGRIENAWRPPSQRTPASRSPSRLILAPSGSGAWVSPRYPATTLRCWSALSEISFGLDSRSPPRVQDCWRGRWKRRGKKALALSGSPGLVRQCW
jgi:hypothetical protein